MSHIDPASATRPDRRVRRTQEALREALVSLILDKGYEATTVQDIVDRADVGRSTFYAHFADKEELLLRGLEELHATLDPADGTRYPSLFASCGPLYAHAGEQRRLYRAIFGHLGGGPLPTRIEQELFMRVRMEFDKLAPGTPASARAMAARVTVSGFLGLLRQWLDDDEAVTSDAVSEAFLALVLPGVAASLGVAPERLTTVGPPSSR
jgi:AcrR family transcriptional regulator